jgi:ElaB/YqjD/DUF883 family membrane-anchored ribosome-binding protein
MADTTTPPTTGAYESQDQGTTAQAQQKAQEVAGQAQEKATEVAGQAKEQAKNVAGQAQEQVRTQVDQRSTQAGEQITQQASDIRSVGESLREQGKDGPAKIAEQAASRIEGVGNYLTEANADRILHDIEDFGRRQPWAIIAGGATLGFLASRFLKASSSDRFEQRYSSSPSQLPNTYTRPVGTTPPALGGTGNELSGGVAPGFGGTTPDVGAPRHTGSPLGTTTETERTRVGGTGTL